MLAATYNYATIIESILFLNNFSNESKSEINSKKFAIWYSKFTRVTGEGFKNFALIGFRKRFLIAKIIAV